jgi:hypothetical protein
MNRLKVIALSTMLVAPAQAFEARLVQIEPPPAWPLLERLDRPHADDPPPAPRVVVANDAAKEIEAHYGSRRHRHHRHRRHR